MSLRTGAALRAALEELANELSTPLAPVTISDIARDGLLAFWPQIRAWHKARAADTSLTADEINRTVAAITKAHQLGLDVADIEAAITNALTAKAATAAA